MPRSFVRKQRVLISRLFSLVVVVLLLISESRWTETNYAGIIFLTGVVLIGFGTVGRLWCTVYIAGYKSNTLITTGPYSICRHPLYLFSLLGMTGVGLSSETLTIPALMILFFIIYYPMVMNSEEKKLAKNHKEAFGKYCQNTPKFFPSFKLLKEPQEYIINPILFRKSMLEVVWFVILLGVIELAETLHETGILPVIFKLY